MIFKTGIYCVWRRRVTRSHKINPKNFSLCFAPAALKPTSLLRSCFPHFNFKIPPRANNSKQRKRAIDKVLAGFNHRCIGSRYTVYSNSASGLFLDGESELNRLVGQRLVHGREGLELVVDLLHVLRVQVPTHNKRNTNRRRNRADEVSNEQ